MELDGLMMVGKNCPTKSPAYRWYFVLHTEDQRKESGFKKNFYTLIDQKAPFLIHYVGSESFVVSFAHKLSKDKPKHFTRTAPSTLN
jgi:hypothetical protein